MRRPTWIVVARALFVVGGVLLVPDVGSAMSREVLFTIYGQPYDKLCSVANAGDFNGDGFSDVIAGGTQYTGVSNPPNRAGKAVVVFGGPSATGAPDMTMRGESPGDRFGLVVAGVGDVNDDGYADVVVGAPAWDHVTGRAYLYFGGPSADSLPDVVLTGIGEGREFGYSVAGIGDVNDDGIDDLLVGYSGIFDRGGVNLYFGRPSFDGVPDAFLIPDSATDPALGWSVAGIGDVNEDGIDDFAIGSSRNQYAAWVYFGGANLLTQRPKRFPTPLSGCSSAVTGVGDVNGDGIRDLAIGWMDYNSTTPNTASLYWGGANMDTIADRTFVSEYWLDRYGMAVEGADIDGDGNNDLLVSAPAHWASQLYLGRVYVYEGGPDADLTADAKITGELPSGALAGDRYLAPKSVARLGDLNGDGTDEIAVGTLNDSTGGDYAGKVEVIAFLPNVASVADRANGGRLKAWPIPFRDGTLHVELVARDSHLATEVDVFDVGGRRLRRLERPVVSAGMQRVTWDGRDEAGTLVRPGVYILRVSSAGHEQRLRIPVVR